MRCFLALSEDWASEQKRKRTGWCAYTLFVSLLVSQSLNLDVGNCPIFPEKISFADVIGCPR